MSTIAARYTGLTAVVVGLSGLGPQGTTNTR